jgi:hypothetical protein
LVVVSLGEANEENRRASCWLHAGGLRRIEVTYMPSVVLFSTDLSLGTCPAGTFLRWLGSGADEATRQANVKAVLGSLLAVKMSGSPVRIYGVNANCEVKFIHLN